MALKCKPPICIRDLRHVVTFAEKTYVRDSIGGGGTETGRTTIFTAKASIEGLSGREQLFAQKVLASVTHKVWLRYNANLKSVDGQELIMQWDGREFNVRSVIDWQERKRWMVLAVEEGVSM